MTDLIEAIERADEIEQEILWAVLKHRTLRIDKKLLCMARVCGVDPDKTLAGALVAENGWILDYENRQIVNEALIRARGEVEE